MLLKKDSLAVGRIVAGLSLFVSASFEVVTPELPLPPSCFTAPFETVAKLEVEHSCDSFGCLLVVEPELKLPLVTTCKHSALLAEVVVTYLVRLQAEIKVVILLS